ncbi:MAG: hypothetical protein Q3959_03565 [Limosilactobacillus sp.]|uniref:hypothetical protein n=1 Tax=Limosilactobacillus sp. TaxID=2773925 RepID=UPI00270A6ADC|nr:hypothetical protein [Limosilactobacillus sp.]
MDNKNPFDDEQMTRQQYREQLERQQGAGTDDGLIHREGRDEDTSYARRADVYEEDHYKTPEEKTAILKRKLNIAIACLIVAIICVYLILIYVG